ncbi:MAG: stage II sporulation protein R [Clostridiales bacterium]|nr:stage II sporulation protein R [Clostridiales bacterium]
MQKYKNLTIGIILGITFLLIWNIAAFADSCESIRSEVLRFHILANSDSEEDQTLKLKIRDAFLTEGSAIFDGTVTAEDAVEKITPEIPYLQSVAESIIKENGFDYSVSITVCEEYFDTRIYNGEVILPAGKYMALKVIIGSGQGQNWWCVMFPSLCLPAAEATDKEALDSIFSEQEEDIILSTDKYTVKFKIVEWIEKCKNKIDNR